jgi:uncharacterized protein YdhG (YjbR/CyaY superfamily)
MKRDTKADSLVSWSMANPQKPAIELLQAKLARSWPGRWVSKTTWARAATNGIVLMAKTDFRSVDDYIATQPQAVQAVLQQVRSAIRKALPSAEEVISYQIPAYRLAGGTAIYFAGWKKHFSVYPATERVIEAFRDELAPYELSKGTIRFPLSEPIPTRLIAGIAKLRAKEVAERANEKLAKKR